MSKTFYTDYIRHTLRFYSRNAIILPNFKSEVDKQNWWACHSIIGSYPDKTKRILLAVYSGYDTLADEVYNASIKWRVEQNWIWDMLKEVEKKIARKRGLL